MLLTMNKSQNRATRMVRAHKAAGTEDGRAFITPQDVEATGLASARRVQELCRQGVIPAVRFGTTWRIRRAEFNAQFGVDL